MILMDINLQFGEFTFQGSSFWSDLLISIAGAIVCAVLGGILAAYFGIRLYRKQRSADRSQILSYMLQLLTDVKEEYEKDIISLKKFKEEVDRNSSELPLLIQRANYDVKRLVVHIDQERCFIAYKERGKEKEFKALYTILDYYNEVIIQIRKELSKSKIYDYERKIEFIQITDDLQEQIRPTCENQQWLSYKDLMDEIRLVLAQVSPQKGVKKDVKYWYENFVIPLKDILNKYESYYPIPGIWFRWLNKAQTLYLEIEEKNKMVADNFDYYTAELAKHTGALETQIETLKTLVS